MLQRTFIALLLALLPVGALADDADSVVDATPAPAATAAPSDAATSSGLGPDAISPSAGGSNADAAGLQPAGLSEVQPSAANSAGLTAPAGALQAPAASSDQLKVLAGEADGVPHQFDDSADAFWPWVGLAITAMLLAGAAVIWRDRRRFRLSEVATGSPSQ